MHSTTIAVDLAKSVFELAVSRRAGQVERRHRFSRGQFSRFLTEQAPATVVMEACGTAHFWGREAEVRGHRVVLIPPHAVRPYVQRNKTDGADAKGLLEALRNQDMRPVPVKSVDQHVLASLHRMRSAWVATRTARLNTLRGLLREIGLSIPVGARQVLPRVCELVSDAGSSLPGALRPALAAAVHEIRELEGRVREVERTLEAISRESTLLARLRTVRAWVCSPPPRWWPSSATCSAFPRVATSRAIWGSRRASTPAVCGAGSEPSASAAIPTCACC
jgi:transposase